MQDSFLKTSKSGREINEKCYMAHGSSRGSSRSNESEGSHLSEKSRNCQRSGKSNSNTFDASISNSDSEEDISYDELIKCYEHLSNQFKKIKAQNKKLKEKLEKNEMIIDNAQAFYEENEKLKMENEKLENEVKNYGIMFSKLKEDHDQVESENFDLKNENERLIDHNENLKFDNDQLNKQISNMAHDHQIKENCNQLVEENNHLKKKIESLYHDRPLNDEWNNAKKKIADLENQIVQSEIEKNKMRNGLNVMRNQLQTSEKEIVALKVEKEKLTNELEVAIKQSQNSTKVHVQKNVQKQSNKLNKKAAKRKNTVSIENQKKKIGLYKVSTSSPSAPKALWQSPTPHHAKRYQRVPPPSSQLMGDQRYTQKMVSQKASLLDFANLSAPVDSSKSTVDKRSFGKILWPKPPYQNPKQRSRRRLSSYCSASELQIVQREIISYKELKPVRSEVKLLHHLVVFKDVKLEVFWTNSLKSSSSGFVSISQNSSSSIFFTNLCIKARGSDLLLDLI
ncbi:hypothetical protein Taro_013500 [Colocasia esculenta]|uniref:Uncharacterized protein n=1 Tax=Colocasia esculenta TaxID=4460 RepID=A0A843UBS9_COLES|nr:hypothetical protein [Colocasia esculenta]